MSRINSLRSVGFRVGRSGVPAIRCFLRATSIYWSRVVEELVTSSSDVASSGFTDSSCLTHSRCCTGCVLRNGSTLNWRSWRTECWTVWRHRIWINSFRYQACQVVAVCGRRSRCSCTSRSSVCQQPAVARFLSQPSLAGTLCQMMCSLHRLSLPSGDS